MKIGGEKHEWNANLNHGGIAGGGLLYPSLQHKLKWGRAKEKRGGSGTRGSKESAEYGNKS